MLTVDFPVEVCWQLWLPGELLWRQMDGRQPKIHPVIISKGMEGGKEGRREGCREGEERKGVKEKRRELRREEGREERREVES